MKTVALVPVKAFAEAKSRLAGAVAPPDRADIAARLLDHVLDAILASDAVDACGVISPDPAALRAAQIAGAIPLAQRSTGLNPSLEEGRAWALAQRADALLVVLGDLPFLTPADVAGLVDLAEAPPVVVLAPDRHGTGSNALLLAPADLLPFRFGPQSALYHAAEAARRGVPLRRYESPGAAFDVDTPADLASWLVARTLLPLGGSR